MSLALSQLSDLVRELRGDAGVRVSGVHHDSRRVEPGDLFVALPGKSADGARFAASAIERGAAAVLTSRALEGIDVPQLIVDDARTAMAFVAERIYGDPTQSLSVIGVTGTNGKTTTTWLIDEALSALGRKPALMGTVERRGPGGLRERTEHTTPESDEIARFAARVRDLGATHLVMEASSHAVSERRVEAVRFAVTAFTHLTQDHLDYHGSMEAYFAAKARLFTDLAPSKGAVILVDDAWGERLAGMARGNVVRCSRRKDANAEIAVTSWSMDRQGVRATLRTPWGLLWYETSLLGAHNVDNLLVAAACLLVDGAPIADLERALAGVEGAPGRLSRVPDPRDVAVLVDYAHTPDALAKALEALRPLTPGRLFAVFGCGGDRDRGKRPLMGRAAGERADVVVITSDNPRTEVPSAIVDEIVPGVAATGLPEITRDALDRATRGYVVEVDRRTAIELALRAARAGDTALIAGKGHEDYQILGTTKIHFDDREEAARVIASLAGERR